MWGKTKTLLLHQSCLHLAKWSKHASCSLMLSHVVSISENECLNIYKSTAYPPSTISSTAKKRPSIFSSKALFSTFFLKNENRGHIYCRVDVRNITLMDLVKQINLPYLNIWLSESKRQFSTDMSISCKKRQ